MTKQELLNKLKELDTCEPVLEWAVKQPSMKTILEECPHEWRMWALCEGLSEFVEYCNWNKLEGIDWMQLLIDQPQLAGYCDWDKLGGRAWSDLLMYRPQFAEHCNWNKLKGNDWVSLLCKQPQLVVHCDWNKLNNDDWLWLLCNQPQFAKNRVQKTEVENDQAGTT